MSKYIEEKKNELKLEVKREVLIKLLKMKLNELSRETEILINESNLDTVESLINQIFDIKEENDVKAILDLSSDNGEDMVNFLEFMKEYSMEQGRVAGIQTSIIRQLRIKFLGISNDLRKLIRECDVEQLNKLVVKIFDVKTENDVLKIIQGE